ncbi:MAG: DUF4340 domain-containing protein [Verrucomicrobia bacterium]|nr:DUF4340 domain-containing protein [Verrucomicrobiota bacterium]
MKGRSSLVLLISILVLGAFIWMQQTWRSNVPSKEYRRVKLFDLDIETLVSIEFQYTNLVVECVKENGVWMTGDPDQGLGRADIALVHRVVAGLNSLGKGTTITAEQLKVRGFDDAEYGFAHPSLRIKAVDNRGEHVWLVGREGPLGDMLYIKEGDGEDIFTISKALQNFVPAEVDQLRDRVAFSVDIAGSRHLEIRGPGGFVQIMKGAKGEWQIQQPIVAMADEGEVEVFLRKLQALRIGDDDFIADNVSDFSVYGLQGETRQISLGGADGTSRMLVFGDAIPDRPDFVYARRADDTSVFALKKEVMELLAVDRDHFRNRRVLPLTSKEIDSVSIIHGTEQLDLSVAEAGEWSITAPVSWDANVRAVNDLLALWDNAVVVEFTDVSSNEMPEWTYVFGSSNLGQTNRIHVLPTQGRRDGLRIKRDDETTVCQLNLRQVQDAATDPLSFKNKLVWRLNVGDIQKVSMEGRDAVQYAVERQEDGTFVPSGTNGTLQVDSTALEGMLEGLEVLMASSYVTYDPRDLSGYGLDKPAIALHVGLSDTNQLGRVLLIGEETDQGYYAMVQGRDVVFLLNKGVVGTFSQNLLIDHEATPAETE